MMPVIQLGQATVANFAFLKAAFQVPFSSNWRSLAVSPPCAAATAVSQAFFTPGLFSQSSLPLASAYCTGSLETTALKRPLAESWKAVPAGAFFW